jgi:hypothetical protein
VSRVPRCAPQGPRVEPTCGTDVATLRATALELLDAVADGLEQPAGQLAGALAAQVLEAPLVRAALLVQAGGPLAIARAVGLAQSVTVAEEHTLIAFAADRLTTGMGVCHDLAGERPARSWPEQVLPYGLAGAMLVTPTGWTVKEATRAVRLRLR